MEHKKVKSKRQYRSPIWGYFVKYAAGAECTVCGAFMKAKNTTTSLLSHLRAQHPDRWMEISHHYPHMLIPDPKSKKNKPQIARGAVVKAEEIILNPTEHNFIEVAIEPEKKGATQMQKEETIPSTDSLIYLIVVDEMPLNISELAGFRQFSLNNLGDLSLPSQIGLRNILDMKYNEISLAFKSNLEMSNSCSLSIAEWADAVNSRRFIGVTCHLIQDAELKGATFGFEELVEGTTEKILSGKLRKVCEMWNIQRKKVVSVSITGDNPMLTNACTDIFGPDKLISCFAQYLNLIAKKPFEDSVELHSLLDTIKQVLDFLKNGDEILVDDYDEGQQFWDMVYTTPTTWRGIIKQMSSLVKFSERVDAILFGQSGTPARLAEETLQELKDVMKIYKSIIAVVDELSLEDYVHASKVIPMIQCLLASLEDCSPDTEVGTITKALIISHIHSRFANMEDKSIFAMATLMDPRFKKNYFKNSQSKDRAIAKLKELINVLVDPLDNQNTGEDDGGIWKFHSSFVESEGPSNTYHPLVVHLASRVTSLKSNPIAHFSVSSTELRSTAERFLVAIASSVQPKRIFSEPRNIIHSNWSSLPIHDLRRLMLLKSVTHNSCINLCV